MAKKTYDDNSIKQLKGPDQVRLRPGVIFGSDGLDGCCHAVFEILSNSIDEAREGYGKEITVTKYLDKSIEVEDHGRGIPIDFNQNEQKYNWELVFCTLYAGGKYDNNSGDSYSFSLGLNGLGLCSTQFASEYMDVESNNGTWIYNLHFEKGFNMEAEERGFRRRHSDGKTGTRIRWKPDLDVFTDIDVSFEYFDDVIRRQAVVNGGLKFVLRNEVIDEETGMSRFEEHTYCYENGISDYLTEQLADSAFTTPQIWSAQREGKDREDKPMYKVKMHVAFAFSNKVQLIQHYHNSSWLEHGGSPEKAWQAAFVNQIDGWLKANSKYNKNEGKVKYGDVADSLVFISSNFSTQTSYENQTKKSITNKFIQEAMTDWLKQSLEVYFLENPDEAAKICEQVLINKRARENAAKTRENIKKSLSQKVDLLNRIPKFVDCRSKDVTKRELYIVEGDSALGAVKQARDSEYQAVMPVRGKTLNCLKASYDQIFKSEIITNLLKILGCGVEVKSKSNKDLSTFDLSNLRWEKIVICTDADVDGYQIRTLILTMLYRLVPTVIEKGYVYIAESPLYEINCKDQTYFAYTEQEKTRILESFGDKKYTIQRSKGLGENEPDMMSLTTMNPETRRLIKVCPEDAEKTYEMFDLLLGNNLDGRKDYIRDYGYLYMDDIDVS
ncbi:MAG: DNA topoisomerase [Ruminiclostridium sp.]|nr:DNA topoisomerase [Ruminiclostridium sp.]